MSLWILEPKPGLTADNNPWVPWHNKMFSLVVRADTDREARKIAHEHGQDENNELLAVSPWLDETYSSCKLLLHAGPTGLIIANIKSA